MKVFFLKLFSRVEDLIRDEIEVLPDLTEIIIADLNLSCLFS